MKIQIVSDLHIDSNNSKVHIDHEKYFNVNKEADILVLAGDIGSLYKIEQLYNFLEQVSKYYKCVIYVFGNHEFYYSKTDTDRIEYEDLLKRSETLTKGIKNLYILNRNSIIINDFLFVGCTLWSNTKNNLPNYFKIHNFNKEMYNTLNTNDIDYIQSQVKLGVLHQKKIIVITHYPPLPMEIKDRKIRDGSILELYYNNLEYLFYESPEISYWIHGHNNINNNKKVNKTVVLSNQHGNRKVANNYKKTFIIKA